jgi:hypothetical protein
VVALRPVSERGREACPAVSSRYVVKFLLLFLAVRACTLVAYRETVYYYGMVSNQFAIADAAYRGHAFSWDASLTFAALQETRRSGRFVPLEAWEHLPRSGRYTTFPAEDVPGYGYLISVTSRWLASRLTTVYAMAAQIAAEACGVLLFVVAAARVFGAVAAARAGLLYVFAYPFVWPMASQPMRDVFAIAIFSTTVLAASAVPARTPARGFALAVALIGGGSVLLWVRPSAYYFPAFVALLVMFGSGRSLGARLRFAIPAVLIPWLVFGLPFRQFNLRHYGVADTDFLGRTLWEHMGVVKGNPYGFVQDDAALVPWVQRHYGRSVEYASPEMNRLLGDYAREVVRRDPVYFLKTRLYLVGRIAATPLDLMPPFRVVEFRSSGMTLWEYLRSHPGSFAYKALNRVLLTGYFYLGVAAAILVWRRQPEHRHGLLVLLSPLLYTLGTLAWTDCEARGMATAAWVLLLPIATAADRMRLRPSTPVHESRRPTPMAPPLAPPVR